MKFTPQLASMGPLTQATFHRYICNRHRTAWLAAAENAIFRINFCPMGMLSIKLTPQLAIRRVVWVQFWKQHLLKVPWNSTPITQSVEEFHQTTEQDSVLDFFGQRAHKRILTPAFLHGKKNGLALCEQTVQDISTKLGTFTNWPTAGALVGPEFQNSSARGLLPVQNSRFLHLVKNWQI